MPFTPVLDFLIILWSTLILLFHCSEEKLNSVNFLKDLINWRLRILSLNKVVKCNLLEKKAGNDSLIWDD